MQRRTLELMLATITLCGAWATRPAAAQSIQGEVGVFGGAHMFSEALELGAIDDPGNATTPRNGGLFGARLALTLPWGGAEAELVGIPSADRRHDQAAYVLGYRGHAVYHVLRGRVRPFVLAGAGLLHVASTNGTEEAGLTKDADGEVHAGAGVKWDLWDNLMVRAEARAYALPSNKEFGYAADWEVLVGATYMLGSPAPRTPGSRSELAASGPDSDGDGIANDLDECPRRAEDKDGFEDDDGCPDKDNDGDGLADASDKCPNERELWNGVEDDDGCPEKDDDRDGVLGAADLCPKETEDKDGFQDHDGCPDADNDGDSVADAEDRCPQQQETRNGFEDTDGCPDVEPRELKALTGILRGVTFASKSAKLARRAPAALDRVATLLKQHPGVRVEVSAHTSNEGGPDKTLSLSKQQAEAVKAYLVKAGVDESRVDAVGHGLEKPIAPNVTRRGRQQNNRVELRVLAGTTEVAQKR